MIRECYGGPMDGAHVDVSAAAPFWDVEMPRERMESLLRAVALGHEDIPPVMERGPIGRYKVCGRGHLHWMGEQ